MCSILQYATTSKMIAQAHAKGMPHTDSMPACTINTEGCLVELRNAMSMYECHGYDARLACVQPMHNITRFKEHGIVSEAE